MRSKVPERETLSEEWTKVCFLRDVLNHMEKQFDFLFKLLLTGDSGVGKTCIIFRFVENKFNPSFITTIGIDFKIRTVEIGK